LFSLNFFCNDLGRDKLLLAEFCGGVLVSLGVHCCGSNSYLTTAVDSRMLLPQQGKKAPHLLAGGHVITTLLLRIASVISLLFTAGHTLGGLKKWSPMGENEVLKAMTTVRFETMGANRSYLDFFMGFGWSISVAMLLQTVLLWQMASLARTDVAPVRPKIAVLALATLASGVIAWRFIFPVPALFSGVLLIALVAAYVVAH
jgi:hypothetical protein